MESIKLKEFELTGVTEAGEELGYGAYARVVHLRFRELKCAGKRFHRRLYDDSNSDEQRQTEQRWYNECAMLSSLRHPNIVQFLGVHFEEGNPLPVLVMEFLPFTLSGHLGRHGVFPLEISYGILADVAKALCYLHGGDPVIIHRDLSANNVLLTTEMRAKISDLGTAKILNVTPAQKSHMSMCPGTMCYMPPEALTRSPVYCTEIDSFSFGVLIVHTFCGQWPLPDEHNTVSADGNIIARTELERREQYLSEFGNDHPLITLIQKCLSNIPSDRPNATDILKRVQTAAKQHPPQFDSVFVLLREINTLTERLQEANSKASKQYQDYCDQLATLNHHYDEQISELIKGIEQKLSEGTRQLCEERDQLEQTLTQEREDHRSRSKSESEKRLKLQLQLEDANFRKSIDDDLIQSHLSQLMSDKAHLINLLCVEEAKNCAQVIKLEKIIEMKSKEHENTFRELEAKKKELNIREKEISTLQAMNKTTVEELGSKSHELELKEDEKQAVKEQVNAMQLQLEAQERSIDVANKQLGEKENQLTTAHLQLKQAREQVEIIQRELELQRRNSAVSEENLREAITHKDHLLDNSKLEMELKKGEISVLQSHLEIKEEIIQDLVKQQKRAQEFLAEKVGVFCPLATSTFSALYNICVLNEKVHDKLLATVVLYQCRKICHSA